MSKKYKIRKDLSKTIEHPNNGRKVTLYRIQALKSFETIPCMVRLADAMRVNLKNMKHVKKGDLGGWIEKEENLSQEGTCWLFDEAMQFDDSYRSEDAVAREHAMSFEYSKQYGASLQTGHSHQYGYSEQYGHSQQMDYSKQSGHSQQYGTSWQAGHSQQCGDSRQYGDSIQHGYSIQKDNSRQYENSMQAGYSMQGMFSQQRGHSFQHGCSQQMGHSVQEEHSAQSDSSRQEGNSIQRGHSQQMGNSVQAGYSIMDNKEVMYTGRLSANRPEDRIGQIRYVLELQYGVDVKDSYTMYIPIDSDKDINKSRDINKITVVLDYISDYKRNLKLRKGDLIVAPSKTTLLLAQHNGFGFFADNYTIIPVEFKLKDVVDIGANGVRVKKCKLLK